MSGLADVPSPQLIVAVSVSGAALSVKSVWLGMNTAPAWPTVPDAGRHRHGRLADGHLERFGTRSPAGIETVTVTV